jgi:hypothetical protein
MLGDGCRARYGALLSGWFKDKYGESVPGITGRTLGAAQ